jgi:hypothetical protein
MSIQNAATALDAAKMLRYADEHKLDVSTDAGALQVADGMSKKETKPGRRPFLMSWLPPEPTADEMLRYAEEHGIDMSTDAGVRKVVEGLNTYAAGGG